MFFVEKEIKFILELLQKYGQGYVVGGYIRDRLLGLTPVDCDFVTDIPYSELLEIFKNFSPKEIGKNFGIIQIKINNITYEIAKMRQDIGTPPNRKVQNFCFTKNIYEDLKRRDFTINSIAFDGKNFFYGEKLAKEDIKNHILRFIGEPTLRIEEDPLRLLRLFRFLATKDLTPKIDLKILNILTPTLSTLSKERIVDEFSKIILGKNLYVLNIMGKFKVYSQIIPNWQENPLTSINISIIKKIENTSSNLSVRLTLFFLNFFPRKNCKNIFLYSQEIKNTLLKMKLNKRLIGLISNFIFYSLILKSNSNKILLKKIYANFSKEELESLYEILEASNSKNFIITVQKIKSYHLEIVKYNYPVTIKDLAINGEDIIKNFSIEKKYIGRLLIHLLNIVLKNPKENNPPKLFLYVRNYIDNYSNSPKKF